MSTRRGAPGRTGPRRVRGATGARGATGPGHWTATIAIIALVFLESFALLRGIDGIALSLSIAAISGLGGYTIRDASWWRRWRGGEQ